MAGHYFSTIENSVTGKPVYGATVLVYEAGASILGDEVTTGTLATIYSDDGITAISQTASPVTTDARGFYEFWTDESSVAIAILYNGAAKQAISDVEIVGGNVSGDLTALGARVDKHDTVFGLAANADDLGTFSGSTISSNVDVKTALQELETELETVSGGAVSPTQTAEAIVGNIGTVADGDYTLVLKAPHGGTVTETTTKSASGTCTATFKVNSTALGGTANSVSSSEQSQAHSSTNTFVAGDDIVLTVSANSSCSKLAFTIKYTRVLS